MTPPVHDHDVSKLYHEGSADEPPAALDRAILKAARENIAPVREARKPWWRRFALPLQLAFSVVLVTMLALTVDRNPPEVPAVTERTEPQQAPVPAPHKAAPARRRPDSRRVAGGFTGTRGQGAAPGADRVASVVAEGGPEGRGGPRSNTSAGAKRTRFRRKGGG